MRILLALDIADPPDTAIEAVIAQFTPQGNEVRVLYAADWERQLPPSYLFAEGPAAATDVFRVRERLLRDAGEHLERVASRLRAAGFHVTTHVCPEGSPRSEIIAAATAWPADLIVVGSHHRSGLDRLLEGSVSEGIVRNAPCSVEVVRLTSATEPAPVT